MRPGEKIISVLVVLFFGVSLILYPLMPEQMVTHWNMAGSPDGYMSRFWGVFLFPAIALLVMLLFSFFGKSDPLRENIMKFIEYYDRFVLLILIFLFYTYLLTISWNFGYKFDMILLMLPGLSILLFYTGVVVEKTKRNFTVGIRTPWTLANDQVWHKTHKLGGKLFKAISIVTLFGLFSPELAFWFFIYPILLVGILLVFYSYREYAKLGLNKSPAAAQKKAKPRR